MTTAKTKTKLWPPIHELTYTSGKTAWQVACQVNGKRIRETFETKAEAETRAAQIRLQVENEGAAALALSAGVRLQAAQAIEALKPYEGETIAKAVDFYIAHSLRFRHAPLTADIIKEFIPEREKLNQRDSNIAELRQRLNVFARTFGNKKLAEITVEELTVWLLNPAWSARSQIHYRRRVSMLYDFAIKRRWCEVNTAALVDNPVVEDTDIESFTVEECARILEHAETAGCLPLVVLSLFAGLRRAEVCRLDWSQINLPERTITIRGKTAKKRSRRVVSINDTCAAWLALCAQPKGAIVTVAKQTLDQRIQNLATKAGLSAWKHNGLRHTFVTYHAAAHKDLPRTAYEAGNSVEVIKRHYDGLASEATAKRFWELRPAGNAGEKIVPIAVNS
ncbi:MAG: Tyrosine recombinase XerC [Verrucomicrobiae bacterium]|nr:Tyrosine recombinase XerC [Verrucomicrobiae bacterium]